MTKEKKKHGIAFEIFRVLLLIIAIIVLAVLGLLAYMTASDYKPADVEKVTAEGTASSEFKEGDQLTVMTWNIGYGALGNNADFFMDGGEMVKSASKERVEENLEGITKGIQMYDPDAVLMQEVDIDASRSYKMDEMKFFQDKFKDYESSFAYNYKAAFVPYPVPPLGKVFAGLGTFTKAKAADIERVQLPIPFKWPVSTVNLKRCLMVSRIPIADSDRELVLINLHLEAYDSGAGKIAQTKMLAEVMQKEAEKGNYVIAGGDFNQLFSSADQDAYPLQEGMWHPGKLDVEAFAGDWQFLMDEKKPSCRSLDKPYAKADRDTFQYYLIDGFIVSDNIDVDEFKTVDFDFENSDHNPVVLKLTLGD